jgi:hypothetical protein
MKSIYLLKTEKWRQRRENGGEVVRGNTLGGGNNFFSGFERSQVVPTRLSGRSTFERG